MVRQRAVVPEEARGGARTPGHQHTLPGSPTLFNQEPAQATKGPFCDTQQSSEPPGEPTYALGWQQFLQRQREKISVSWMDISQIRHSPRRVRLSRASPPPNTQGPPKPEGPRISCVPIRTTQPRMASPSQGPPLDTCPSQTCRPPGARPTICSCKIKSEGHHYSQQHYLS